MARIPAKVEARISTGIRKYQKILAAARDRDVNESDTVVIIADFLSEVLGFDKYSEVTTEFCIRGTFCDLAVRLDGKLRLLIEAKAVGTALKEPHLRQAIGYATQHGIDWVALTNGITWRVYKVRFEQPICTDLVIDLDILESSPRSSAVLDQLYLLSREGLSKSAIDEFHEQKDACKPALIAAVILSDGVLPSLRRELRRVSPGAKIDQDDLTRIIREEVIKRELIEGDEAKAAASRVRRRSAYSLRQAVDFADPESEPAAALSQEPPA
jgi:hypothetical protein